MWTKAVTFEQFHRYWKEMCGYAKFTQPVASMAGSILVPPEVKIHTWKQCAQGAALLSANVTRIDVSGHVTPSRLPPGESAFLPNREKGNLRILCSAEKVRPLRAAVPSCLRNAQAHRAEAE